MASAILSAEVGYPGSSIAFAQLLSGMQRSGLIEREVRGKRTYRIAAAPGAAARVAAARVAAAAQTGAARRPAAPGGAAQRAPSSVLAAGEGGRDLVTAAAAPGDFDYDELARRLLVQVVRRLASAPEEETPAAAGTGGAALEQTVAGLERELASVRTMHGTLTAENARLREQLRAVRRNLALAQDRAAVSRPVSDQLDAAQVGLLERLLTPAADETRHEDAETG